ncbi:MAG: hypothetical protein LBC73_05005 [Oscillospiraceae bacterium]|jgi:hypothetical protein|nr:hypothetical protein [Oscillospiraceae bacterium]
MKLKNRNNQTETEARAVYSVTIDLSHNYRERMKKNVVYSEDYNSKEHFCSGGVYYFSSENRVTYEAVKDFVVNVLVSDVAKVAELHVGTPVTIKVNGDYDGSLIIVFSAIFSTVQFISGLKDVYDVTKLIRDLANERITTRLYKEYGNYLSVSVSQRIPSKSYDDYNYEKRMIEKGYWHTPFLSENKKLKRDAFFWYLLGLNIVLFILLVLLTINALVTVYW